MHGMTRNRKSRRGLLGLIALLVFAAIGLTACPGDDDKDGDSQKSESTSRQDSYDTQVAKQPAHTMSHSPTRDTGNFWIDTWDEPGKLSYVYLQSSDGTLLGYYVLKGLPVSYCVSLTPNYEKIRIDGIGETVETIVPAPGVDGVYYSGGQCNTYYGQDATTGNYVEYTVGMGINVLLFDAPMPRQNDAQPLGATSIDDVT